MSLSVVFMGTPEFAVPVLEELARHFQVTGVITQPDRPSGRGRKLIAPATKVTADSLNLDLYQPTDVNFKSALARIRSWNPDLITVAAFGQILSPELLSLPPYGCLNVHASLLPRWRGASPINAAILHADSNTGVTIMKMAEGLDDGPILTQSSFPLQPDDTAGSLSIHLSRLGANLLVKTIPQYISGDIQPQPQDQSNITYAPRLKRQDGLLDFSQSADQLVCKVRAYTPWPGTFTFWKELRLIIHQVRAEDVTSPGSGVFTTYDNYPAIGTAEGILVLEILQQSGKNKVNGQDFLRGVSDWNGS
ncbi:MAG: methionyl-tRNA formyltransferase [Anaerolineales bacterium]|nr:methionyl-tRNA formyltransferase [Anaerolineales bacterium]